MQNTEYKASRLVSILFVCLTGTYAVKESQYLLD